MDAVRGMNRTFEEYNASDEWSRTAEADTVKIFLPGFKREEIRVLVDNHGHLRTRGERLVSGNRWSRFQKDFQLPADCNADGIRAKFDNETLTITLPKKSPLPQAPTVPASMPPQPEPRRPATAPPQKPPQALPEIPKPSPPPPRAPATTPVPPTTLPPAPSQMPERRPSLPRKPPSPEQAPPPMPEQGSELLSGNRYNGRAATTKPDLAALLKLKEEVKEDKKPLPPATAEKEEEKKRMEREARGKMIEEEEKKKKAIEEKERMMEMAQQRRPFSANRGLLVNVAVAVVVLVGITAYLWHTLRNATAGGDHGHGEPGAGSYNDEM